MAEMLQVAGGISILFWHRVDRVHIVGLFGTVERSWVDITREEREFCAVLFSEVSHHDSEFVEFLNENTIVPSEGKLNLPTEVDWDIGLEVALYRDLDFYGIDLSDKLRKIWKDPRGPGKGNPLRSAKARKFDLALMSEHHIVVIEAKADGGFDSDDISKLAKDRSTIESYSPGMAVTIIGLHSSRYMPLTATREAKNGNGFDAFVTWDVLSKHYPNIERWMNRADEVKTLTKGYGFCGDL